jgi:hypothetical protein
LHSSIPCRDVQSPAPKLYAAWMRHARLVAHAHVDVTVSASNCHVDERFVHECGTSLQNHRTHRLLNNSNCIDAAKPGRWKMDVSVLANKSQPDSMLRCDCLMA